MKQFDYQSNIRIDRFMYLFTGRGDKLTSDVRMTFVGDFEVHRCQHAEFGKCVGISGMSDRPLVFSERPIPADYPQRAKSAA